MKKSTFGAVALIAFLFVGCNALTRGLDRSYELTSQTGDMVVATAEGHAQLRQQLTLGQITLEQFNELSAEVDKAGFEAAAQIVNGFKQELSALKGSVKSELAVNAPQAANSLIGGVIGGQDLISAAIGAIAVLVGGSASRKSKAQTLVEAEHIANAKVEEMARQRDRSRVAQGHKPASEA